MTKVTNLKPGISRDGDTWNIRVQIQRDGKTYDKKKQVMGITLQRALALQAEMRLELERSLTQGTTGAKDSFQTFYADWQKHLEATGKVRASTNKIRLAVANTLLFPFFGPRPMDRITRKDVRQWMEWLGTLTKPDGSAYARDYFATAWRDLKAMFSDAMDLLLLPENPTANMEFAAKGADPKEKDSLTLDETERLLQAAEAESFDVCCMIWVAVTTGMRFGEITSLDWNDIDFAKDVIYIRKSQVGGAVGKTKNGRNRIAPLHPQVKVLLLKHQSQQKTNRIQAMSGIVFPSNVGTYRFPNMMVQPLANCCLRAGITKHITAHSLRRTCNNIMRMELGDVAARKMLGHVSESQTYRYSNVEASELLEGQAKAFGALKSK